MRNMETNKSKKINNSNSNNNKNKDKNKIKILIEGISQNIGGIETAIFNIYKNIDKNKYEISFLVDKELTVAYYDEYVKGGCKFFKTENRKKSYYKYLRDLKKIYINNEFDIIHINVMSYSLFERIIYACKYSKAKIIVHSHFAGYTKGYYRTRILHFIGKIAVKNKPFYKIACGEKAGRHMFGKADFEVIKNGIDIDKFTFSKSNRELIRKEFNIPKDTTAMILVGVFNPVKNHSFLIDIFREYIKLNPKTVLILVGEGRITEKIQEKVKNYGLQKKVVFTGRRNDVNKIYSASDICVMPSISEGLSVTLCEAQINGLRCYTSDKVDLESDISGNIEFLSLDMSAKEWAEKIYSNIDRDDKVLDKIPDEYKLKESCEKMYNYYDRLISKEKIGKEKIEKEKKG